MPRPRFIEIVQKDLFTAKDQLVTQYPENQVDHILRLRYMYQWFLENPDAKDKTFIKVACEKYKISMVKGYEDLAIIKILLPLLSAASRDFHRFRANEMLLETYRMAKMRKDVRTMERAASSYAKYNRVELEDEQVIPYDDIVVQPFTATSDPSVLGIKPIPDLQKKIDTMISKYRQESIDIEDIEYEPADIEERLFLSDEEKEKQDEDG